MEVILSSKEYAKNESKIRLKVFKERERANAQSLDLKHQGL